MKGLPGVSNRQAISFIARAKARATQPVATPTSTVSQTLHLGGRSQQLNLGKEPVVLGRANDSGVRITDTDVSRQHAKMQATESGLYLQDLGSLNGTYVDGQLLAQQEWKALKPDSQISLGRNPNNLISLDGQVKREIDTGMVARDRKGQQVDLPAEGSELLFGRDSGLPESDTSVSRQHMAIRQNAGAFWVKDLGSRNGTYLGDSKEPIEPGKWFEVKHGVDLKLGGERLQIGPKFALPGPTQNDTVETPAVDSAPTLRTLSSSESDSLLQKARIAPSPEGRSFDVPDLTPNFLKAKGFEPKHSISVGDSKIHLSKPYRYDGRTCAVGYVEGKDGQVHVRSMYRSASHGLWKVATHAGQDGWFGKGVSQESILLPLEAQEALAGTASKGEDSPLAKQLFYGSLARGGMLPPQDFCRDLKLESLALPDSSRDKYPVPDKMVLQNLQEHPDFSKPGRTFQLETEVQGRVKASVVPSKDGKNNFMFCQDKEGRAWLGAVFPARSEVNSFGVNKTWISADPLTSPALDYAGSQRADFMEGHVQGHYYDYSAYTKKLPVVADFLKSQNP